MSEETRPVWFELLARPESLIAGGTPWPRAGGALVAALAAGTAAYGAAAACFDGGWQVLVGAAKLPLVLAGALLLCLPSFVVVHLLAGVELPVRRLLLALAGLGGLIGLLAGALVPIGWLFSVSSRSAGFLVFAHAVVWTVVVLLGLRFLRTVLPAPPGGRRASGPWLVVLWLVALQLASLLGPVVHRAPGERAWQMERGFFLARWVQATAREDANACRDCGGPGSGAAVP